MVNSNKRADVVLYKGLYNVLTDVRTIAGGDPRYCCAAALSPGHGAAWGAVQKNAAWLAQAKQCRKTPLGLLRPGARGTLFSPSATRWGGAMAAAARFFLTSSAPSLPRRQANAWLSGSMLFSDCMRPPFEGWPLPSGVFLHCTPSSAMAGAQCRSAAVARVAPGDGPHVGENAVQALVEGHVGALVRVNHEIGDLAEYLQ